MVYIPIVMFFIGIGFLGISYLLRFSETIAGQWTTTFGIVFTIMSGFAHMKIKKLKREKMEAERYE